MPALVTGATGLIGAELAKKLDRPRVLARDPDGARSKLAVTDAIAWDSNQPLPPEALRDVDIVFHLAGEPVAGGRLDDARKQRVKESRVRGTRNVVQAMRGAKDKPRVLVCASAVGFYGSRGDEILTEASAPGSDFLAEVCQAWEAEALEAKDFGVRVVCARIGVVLAREGGALAAMRPAFRFGVGGPLGSGKQWMPWIHVSDVVGLLLHAAAKGEIEGPMNVCGPEPVQNDEFSRALGRAMRRPSFMRTPTAALRLVLGDMADVVLASLRVLPEKAKQTGYVFQLAALDAALRDAVQ